MIRLKYSDIFLPLLVLAFTALAVTFLQPIFTLKVRWGILALCFLYTIQNRSLSWPSNHKFGQLSAVFVVWCFATTIWSEVPDLSFMKSAAFCLVAWTGLAIGEHWVKTHSIANCLNFLFPLMVITLLAAVLGRNSSNAVVAAGAIKQFQGMVDGPNMFGSMVAMSFPLLAIQSFVNWRWPQRRLFWIFLSVVFSYYLIISASRSAFLVAMFTFAGLYCGLGSRSKGQLVFLTLICAAMSVLTFSDLPNQVKSFVYKDGGTERSLLYTRESVWSESWELAQKGGVFGGGYGVTIGRSEFAGGMTTIGYGREKGNSQLGIIEETGWIGLAVYLVSIFLLFQTLVQKMNVTPQNEFRVVFGTIIGLLVGLIAQSIFEAWWAAPGSSESMYFWIMAGVALGLARDPRTQNEPNINRSSNLIVN